MYVHVCACVHPYLRPSLKCQVTKLQFTVGVSHSPCPFAPAFYLSLVLTRSTSGSLADAPWFFYQNAEYLFHTHPAQWEDFAFLCGWLRGDILSIYSAQEQEFILSKIRVVPEHKSLHEIHSLHLLLSLGKEICLKFGSMHSFKFS